MLFASWRRRTEEGDVRGLLAPAALCVGVGLFASGLAVGSLFEKWQRRRRKVRQEGLLLPFEHRAATLTKDEVFAMRRRLFCGAQSVSYDNTDPLMAMQGDGTFIVDEAGKRYLDTRNNVGHVGWQNRDVVGAMTRQLSRLNCNQRYLHPYRVLLAERLLGTLPGRLGEDGVCFFVNSGSEANDLAIRLAKAFTKRSDFIVLEHAYHGHTDTVLCVSPYKYNKKQGVGKQEWVHQVPSPGLYRGQHPVLTDGGDGLTPETACKK